MSGVQVYFFTEKQKTKFEEELAKWRNRSEYQAQDKLSDWDTLIKKREKLFAAHADSDGNVEKQKVSAEVWAEISSLDDQLEALRRIAPQTEWKYWKLNYPSAFDRAEDGIYKYDFHKIGEGAAWAVTDTNGAFTLSLTLGKVYWVWCSGSTSGHNVPISNPWLFKYVPDGGKLVLSDVNRITDPQLPQ